MELLTWSRQDAKLHLIGLAIQDKHVNIADSLHDSENKHEKAIIEK